MDTQHTDSNRVSAGQINAREATLNGARSTEIIGSGIMIFLLCFILLSFTPLPDFWRMGISSAVVIIAGVIFTVRTVRDNRKWDEE